MSNNLGPLTATFTPSSWCSSYDGITFSTLDNGASYFLQGPLTTSGCLPPNYNPQYEHYYSPGVCPQGYTVACSASNAIGSLTESIYTCCPTAGSMTYGCNGPVNARFEWESTLGCHYSITKEITIATVTRVSAGQTSTATNFKVGGGGIGAYPVVVRTQKNQPTDTTASSSPKDTTTPPTGSASPGSSSPGGSSPTNPATNESNGSKGLSAGAAAGIGIGSAVAAVAAGVGAFLLWRRSRRQTAAGVYSPANPSEPSPGTYVSSMYQAPSSVAGWSNNNTPSPGPQWQSSSYQGSSHISPEPQELGHGEAVHELPSH